MSVSRKLAVIFTMVALVGGGRASAQDINVVVSIPSGSSVVPYAAAGIGDLSMFQRPELNVTTTDTYLTSNVGGGVKWQAPNGRWGLRGDYRFVDTRSNATSSTFFGSSDRFGHRIYGAVVINAVR